MSMRSFRGAFIGVIAFIALFVVAVGVVLSIPSVRYQAFRAISELPSIGTYFLLRKSVVSRDFSAANDTLQSQLDLAQDLKVEQSVLLPGLIQNTDYVLNVARFGPDYMALLPFLSNLADSYPDVFLPQLWLGQAYTYSDPQKAVAVLEKAAALAGADERTYRYAIDAAVRLGDKALTRSWCNRYQANQLGGTHPFDFNTLFVGTGLRKILIAYPGDGGTVRFVENQGLNLGERRTYSFAFPETAPLTSLNVHFGTPRSLVVELHGVTIKTLQGDISFIPGELQVTGRQIYLLEGNRILLTDNFGDEITVRWPGNQTIEADRVDIFMTLSRPPLAKIEGCS